MLSSSFVRLPETCLANRAASAVRSDNRRVSKTHDGEFWSLGEARIERRVNRDRTDSVPCKQIIFGVGWTLARTGEKQVINTAGVVVIVIIEDMSIAHNLLRDDVGH